MIKKIILLALINTVANAAVVDCKVNTCVNTSTGGRDIVDDANQITPVLTKPAYYDPDSGDIEFPKVCVWNSCYSEVTINISGYKLKRLNGVVVK